MPNSSLCIPGLLCPGPCSIWLLSETGLRMCTCNAISIRSLL